MQNKKKIEINAASVNINMDKMIDLVLEKKRNLSKEQEKDMLFAYYFACQHRLKTPLKPDIADIADNMVLSMKKILVAQGYVEKELDSIMEGEWEI